MGGASHGSSRPVRTFPFDLIALNHFAYIFHFFFLGCLICCMYVSCVMVNKAVKKIIKITETTKSLIDVILTTNTDIVSLSDVLACSVSDHHLVYLVLTLKTPRLKPSYVTIRSYANYNAKQFSEDLSLVPFHIISMFDDFDEQVETFNALFTDILDDHAPLRE